MSYKDIVIKLGILITVSVVTFMLLNSYVMKTGALDGISLSEYLTDEFRLQVLGRISQSPYGPEGMLYGCRTNDSHSLIPHCRATYSGLSTRIASFEVTVNSIGVRDKEYSLDKPEGTYRIFILGDSYTFGDGVDNEDAYPKVLERALNARFAQPLFEVFNLGVNGASTDDELYRLREFLEYSPDLVILQVSTNNPYECISIWDKALSDLGISEADAGVKYMEIYNYTYTLPLEEKCSCVHRYLKELINETNQAGIPLILYEFCCSPEEHSCFRGVDGVTTLVHETQGRPFELSRADHHLNRKGHIHAAGELLPLLVDIINESTPALLTLSSVGGGYAHEP